MTLKIVEWITKKMLQFICPLLGNCWHFYNYRLGIMYACYVVCYHTMLFTQTFANEN